MKIIANSHSFVDRDFKYLESKGIISGKVFTIPDLEFLEKLIKEAPCPLMFGGNKSLNGEDITELAHPYEY